MALPPYSRSIVDNRVGFTIGEWRYEYVKNPRIPGDIALENPRVVGEGVLAWKEAQFRPYIWRDPSRYRPPGQQGGRESDADPVSESSGGVAVEGVRPVMTPSTTSDTLPELPSYLEVPKAKRKPARYDPDWDSPAPATPSTPPGTPETHSPGRVLSAPRPVERVRPDPNPPVKAKKPKKKHHVLTPSGIENMKQTESMLSEYGVSRP